jgi:hypothetical protein
MGVDAGESHTMIEDDVNSVLKYVYSNWSDEQTDKEAELRGKYPALATAWEAYQITLKMCQAAENQHENDARLAC